MDNACKNIQFNYLYRDGGNFKIFAYEIFSNPDGLELEFIGDKIQKALIDGLFFDPTSLGIRRLKHDDWIPELDHSWNEFESLEITLEDPTTNVTISEFLLVISRINN